MLGFSHMLFGAPLKILLPNWQWRWLELFSLPLRLQVGMSSLAILFVVEDRTGSLAQAALATAASAIGLACTGTIKGRLVDKIGLRSVLIPLAWLNLLSGIILLLCGSSLWAILPAAAIYGACRINITTYLRVVWYDLHSDPLHARQAGSMESSLTALMVSLGAPLAGILTAVVSANFALMVTVGCAFIGSLGVHYFLPKTYQHSTAPTTQSFWQLLVRLHGLLGCALFREAAVAMLTIAVAHTWSPTVAGILIGSYGIGRLVGGPISARLAMRYHQASLLMISMIACSAVSFLLAGQHGAIIAGVCICGIGIGSMVSTNAGADAALLLIVDHEIGPTEAVASWMTAGTVGQTIGSLLAAPILVISSGSIWWAMAALWSGATVCTWLARRTLNRSSTVFAPA